MSKIPSTRSRPGSSRMSTPVSTNGETRSTLRLGERVSINEKTGVIAFIGPTQFASGEWLGVILDRPEGKNDGSCEGVRYFRAQPNYGLFCRPERAQRLHLEENLPDFQIGDRVLVAGKKYGVLRYIGPIHVSQGIWCGVKLDEPVGKNNGKIGDKRYFRCSHRYGLFAPIHRVEKVQLSPQEKRSLARQSMISATSFDQSNDSESDENENENENENRLEHLQKQLKLLQEQYETKIRDYETLISEHFVMKQKLDELKTEVEEYRLAALEKEHQPIIPDGFQLISNEQFEHYENLEDFLIEKDEKMRQDQQKFVENLNEVEENLRQTKRQLELVENRCTTLQEEKLAEIQANRVLERQNQYEDEIRNYQKNFDEAKEKIDEIGRELTEIQQEKVESDRILDEYRREIEELKKFQKNNETINELNKIHEEKQRQFELVRVQQQNEYEEQIRSYEKNLAEATEKVENIAKKLKEIEEEKTRSDRNFVENSDALKNEIEQLRIEREKPSAEEIQTLREENEHKTTLLRETKSLYEKELDEFQKDLENAVRERDEFEEKLREKEILLESVRQEIQKHVTEVQADDRAKIDELEEELKEKIEQLDQLEETNRILMAENSNLQHELVELKTQFANEMEKFRFDFEQKISSVRIDDDLLAKQTSLERSFQEKIEELVELEETNKNLQRHLIEVEQKLTEIKNENAIEMENLRLDYEQKISELKTQMKFASDREDLLMKQIDEQEVRLRQLVEVKSENAIEMENLRLDYEQKVLQLRNRTNSSARATDEIQQKYEELLAQQTSLERSYQEKMDQLEQQELHLHQMTELEETNQNLIKENSDFQHQRDKLIEERGQLDQQLDELQNACEKLQRQFEEKENEEISLKTKIAQVKSEYAIEMENMRLDYEQKILELRNQMTSSARDDEDLQKKYEDLLAKQTSLERSYQEKMDQLDEQEVRLRQLVEVKSEHAIEMENMRLDYEQRILELKNQMNSAARDDEDLQQKYEDLLAKQTSLERSYQEKMDQLDQQDLLVHQLTEFEETNENLQRELKQKLEEENWLKIKLAEVKSEYAIEMENLQLDYEQKILQLKKQTNASTPVDDELKQKYEDLLAKQTSLERSFQEKIENENALRTKLGDYEVKLAMMKSENMVEIENMKYDYEQAILKLKAQLQSATPSKGKK